MTPFVFIEEIGNGQKNVKIIYAKTLSEAKIILENKGWSWKKY